MKKILIAAISAMALCAGLLAGCAGGGTTESTDAQNGSDGKIEVVCATFPAYDFVNQVIGENSDKFDVTYLMGSGADLHSYQPSVEDIAKISDADLFVYIGGESDKWASNAAETAGNTELRTVSMLEAVGDAAVEEEIVEGMEEDVHDSDHGDEADEGDHDGENGHADEETEYDEHVWLSLRNAQTIVSDIAAQLSAIDPENAESYAANAESYNAKLAELDQRYAAAVEAGTKDAFVFADRFPFRYLADDYGLTYYAAFPGCSAETEASFETVAFLANKIDELGLTSVLAIEGSDQEIARTVIENTADKNQEIVVMDSLQSATDEDVAAGKSYLDAMESNLDALTAALK